MKSRVKFVLIATLVVIVVFLLLPFIFKDRTEWTFNGPDLSELQYTEIFFKNEDLTLS